VLEDEDGHNCDTKYLGTKQGLSAGWRGFAIDHGIKVGDVVVFQLVSSKTIKASISQYNFICLIALFTLARGTTFANAYMIHIS
jgi:hypothetical protein